MAAAASTRARDVAPWSRPKVAYGLFFLAPIMLTIIHTMPAIMATHSRGTSQPR
jgi:hypothetical protein